MSDTQRRDAMDDAEFWEHVLLTEGAGPDEDDGPDEPEVSEYGRPCGICGSLNECGVDDQGRPMIHAEDT